MAKSTRGLPSDFLLDLPDEGPVQIGDFLDEAPPVIRQPRLMPKSPPPQVETSSSHSGQIEVIHQKAAPKQAQTGPSVIRYQLNLTPKAKKMLEELVEYVRTYSPETDARTSEVFQGVIGLLHNAMDDLELSELPRRGAWGSVTARNFPGALSEAFERAILKSAKGRPVG